MRTYDYKVYNCSEKGDFALETCIPQGHFKYPSSAIARLAECTGSRAWIEKSGSCVTDELIATASLQIKEKLAAQVLAHDMKYGRASKGAR